MNTAPPPINSCAFGIKIDVASTAHPSAVVYIRERWPSPDTSADYICLRAARIGLTGHSRERHTNQKCSLSGPHRRRPCFPSVKPFHLPVGFGIGDDGGGDTSALMNSSQPLRRLVAPLDSIVAKNILRRLVVDHDDVGDARILQWTSTRIPATAGHYRRGVRFLAIGRNVPLRLLISSSLGPSAFTRNKSRSPS